MAKTVFFLIHVTDWIIEHFLWDNSQMYANEPHILYDNIGSGNGLMPLGIKPLPEPLFTQIYAAIYRH